jgi:hypothetical protein
MRTGPFTKSRNFVNGAGANVAFASQTWYRNGKDRKTPNPYFMVSDRLLSGAPVWYPSNLGSFKAGGLVRDGLSGPDIRANNDAYAKFRDAVSANSSLGTTLAEWDQSFKMIASRAFQMANGLRALRKGRFGDLTATFEDTLFDAKSASAKRRKWEARKASKRQRTLDQQLSDLWLETHFGWEPLIKDIGAAVAVLQEQAPSVLARGRGRCEIRVTGSRAANQPRDDYTYISRCLMQSRVRVINPNLHLADQMGFINPVGIAWELVPFSFVVDWFVPVGAFINSFTDFVGLELFEYFVTTSRKCTADFRYNPGSEPEPYVVVGESFLMNRVLTKPSVRLGMYPLKVPSISRAATQVSLLLQQLHR